MIQQRLALYQRDTLDLYTTKPPPPHNFNSLLYVTNARPLRDLRRRIAEARV